MKKEIIQLLGIIVILGIGVSGYTQTFDTNLTANPSKTLLLPTLPDGSTWNIGIENGLFSPWMKPVSYEDVGVTNWTTPGCGNPTADSLQNACGAGLYSVTYKKTGTLRSLDLYIRYYVNVIDSTVGSASFGSKPKKITLPSGVSQAKVCAGGKLDGIWYGKVGQSGTLWDNSSYNKSFSVNLTRGTYWFKARDGGFYDTYDTITIEDAGPIVYNLSNSGSYCEGSSGRSIILSGSETTASYQLKTGSTNVGSAKTGTGASLTWTNITAGNYTVVATNSSGSIAMNGTVTITMDPLPGTVSITGPTLFQVGSGGTFVASASNANSYQWNGGTSEGASKNLSFASVGVTTITVNAVNTCGYKTGSYKVTVIDTSALYTQIKTLTTQVTQLKADTATIGQKYRTAKDLALHYANDIQDMQLIIQKLNDSLVYYKQTYKLLDNGSILLSVNTVTGTFKVNVYPNPTWGPATITADDIMTEINIYNSAGILVYSGTPNTTSWTVNLSENLNVGGYYLIDIMTTKGHGKLKLLRNK